MSVSQIQSVPHKHASLSSADLTRGIKEEAARLGFQKVGIVSADPLSREEAQLHEWLSREYHGDMRWLARDPQNRADPGKIFPDARSVVAVAINYYTPHRYAETPGTGKVSRYAWGDDYHEVVGTKLRELLAWIKEQVPSATGKVCVDIQPIMDKAWAARAGLGWIGKHTNLITPELGSWVFLGELLLNIDLEYETEVIDDHCGSCTLCIDACPTAAITEPYVLDSNKCISYLTIEFRGPQIPEQLTERFHGWLYGCDICQDVCPWNRFAEPAGESEFQPRPGNVDSNLQDILQLTHETYAQRFRGSAMKRAKLTGLQRNAKALLDRSTISNEKHGD